MKIIYCGYTLFKLNETFEHFNLAHIYTQNAETLKATVDHGFHLLFPH